MQNQLDFVSVQIRPWSDDDFEEHMAVIASKLSYTKWYNHFTASWTVSMHAAAKFGWHFRSCFPPACAVGL